MTTESDRELLELAAKAAGIKAIRGPDGLMRDCTGLDKAFNILAAPLWNPLTDDGDALRLAVALGLVVDCSRPSAALPFTRHDYILSEDDDRARATRRAITRAAASIGRGEGC